METKWKKIAENYSVSERGELRNDKTNKMLKLRPNHGTYLKTNISINGKLKTVFVHRLVAEAFIPNPNNYPFINHKDENKQNNGVDNLEWCTPKYNSNYGNALKGRTKKLKQYDLNGNLIEEYNSVKEASIKLNLNGNCIYRVCSKHRKTYKGFKWSY